MIEENFDHSNVIVASSPVERGFGMAANKLLDNVPCTLIKLD